ncbi:MAG: histidine kinase dimerization/phosphoacceptor domain -containing protein [Microcoleaceae cyanobacterium]
MLNLQPSSNQPGLFRQLLIRVGVTLLIIGIIILSINYYWKIADSKQQIRNQAQSITVSLELIIPELIKLENKNKLIPILQTVSQMPNMIQVIIMNAESIILMASTPHQIIPETHLLFAKIESQLQKISQLQTPIYCSLKIQKQPIFIYITPIQSSLTPPKFIILVLDLQSIFEKAWFTFLNSIFLLIGGCLIILVLIGILLRQAILTPFNQLYHSLIQYQQGLVFNVPEQLPHNEIGLLSKAIYDQFIDLKQTNAQLKIEVIERQKAEKKIQTALEEKELLLREIHHRVKNNLFIVSQLLELQSSYLDNSQLSQILKECQDRIYSMVLVHETLYKTTNLKSINFANYLKSLIYYLNQSYNTSLNSPVEIQLELQPIIINIETANPCGLIVHELISNAFKHAFNKQENRIIQVFLNQNNMNQICLQIHDNGIGFPANLNFQQVDSLGLELVRTLTQQLQATLEIDSRCGTLFKLTFTELNYAQ